MSKKVYLAGPIKGLTYDKCNSWREYAIEELAKHNIIGVSPIRCKEYLNTGELLLGSYETPLSCDRGIVTRDRWDVTKNCDVMLVNLLGAEKISIGTMFEYAWADMARKPIITVIELEGNIHDHAFVRETTGFRVETLKQGLEIAVAILNP
jgi:nucleoside 2-deoxyribosyltransferase